MVPWCSVQACGWTHNTGVGSSIPLCVTIKTPLVRKAMGSHLKKPLATNKLRALSLVSATLEIEYAMQYFAKPVFYPISLMCVAILTITFFNLFISNEQCGRPVVFLWCFSCKSCLIASVSCRRHASNLASLIVDFGNTSMQM